MATMSNPSPLTEQELVFNVLMQHRGTATKFCGGCDWDGDTYMEPDGSRTQRDNAMEIHQASKIIEALATRRVLRSQNAE